MKKATFLLAATILQIIPSCSTFHKGYKNKGGSAAKRSEAQWSDSTWHIITNKWFVQRDSLSRILYFQSEKPFTFHIDSGLVADGGILHTHDYKSSEQFGKHTHEEDGAMTLGAAESIEKQVSYEQRLSEYKRTTPTYGISILLALALLLFLVFLFRRYVQ